MPIFGRLSSFDANAVTYAEGRSTNRTYISRSFELQFGRDAGQPGRYIHRVFDEVASDDEDDWDWTTDVVYKTPGGRKQLELQVAREAGSVRKIKIQKVPTSGDRSKLEPVLELDRGQSRALLDLLKALDSIPIEGENTDRVDDHVLRAVMADPEAVSEIYASDPERFRALIESDAQADDVVALGRRRAVAAQMRLWLEDDDAFAEAAADAGGPERAWQALLEANPWVLGIGLGGQLLTSWSEGQLEQTVVGRSIAGVGKRADALMRTSGIVRSLVFAEIKHHRTQLLAEEYRSGCWSPSKELAGAVVQVQQTVHLAAAELDEFFADVDEDGARDVTGTFVIRPRSFVVVGSTGQLTGKQGLPFDAKVRSFELFRRNLYEPEVITFDELVARAEWHVEIASELTSPVVGDEGAEDID